MKSKLNCAKTTAAKNQRNMTDVHMYAQQSPTPKTNAQTIMSSVIESGVYESDVQCVDQNDCWMRRICDDHDNATTLCHRENQCAHDHDTQRDLPIRIRLDDAQSVDSDGDDDDAAAAAAAPLVVKKRASDQFDEIERESARPTKKVKRPILLIPPRRRNATNKNADVDCTMPFVSKFVPVNTEDMCGDEQNTAAAAALKTKRVAGNIVNDQGDIMLRRVTSSGVRMCVPSLWVGKLSVAPVAFKEHLAITCSDDIPIEWHTRYPVLKAMLDDAQFQRNGGRVFAFGRVDSTDAATQVDDRRHASSATRTSKRRPLPSLNQLTYCNMRACSDPVEMVLVMHYPKRHETRFLGVSCTSTLRIDGHAIRSGQLIDVQESAKILIEKKQRLSVVFYSAM